MNCYHIGRSQEGSKGFNTLAPSRGYAYILEIYEDVLLPENVQLEVEGLIGRYSVPVAEFHDVALGVYRFYLEDPMPGALCRATLRWQNETHVLFDGVDLAAHIDTAMQNGNTEPLQINMPDWALAHWINVQEE